MIHVLRAGLLTTVQDAGRPGYQRFGVVAGGAADPFAARTANRLVGNDGGAALLEMAFAGPKLRFERESLVAWCGADFMATLDGEPLPKDRPVRVPAGGTLDFPAARHETMAWLAIAGGLDTPVVLGSRSTDLAGGFGGWQGRKLTEGDVLPAGPLSSGAQATLARLRARGKAADWFLPPERLIAVAGPGVLRVVRGPEWDWFSDEARRRFFHDDFRVTKDGNRMGIRLEGPELTLAAPREMVSAAVQHGAVQVPPSGQPILLGVDRQTIGGYPRIGVVATVDLGKIAQLRPGDTVRFREISVAGAHALLVRRERDLTLATAFLPHF
jgi:antagonist of KipI